jgi:diguanylate cyclase (GGDEF)-like protein
MRKERATILASSDYEDMKSNLRSYYLENNDYFRGSFFLMLNEYYFEDAASEDSEALSECYEADFDATVALLNGKEADDEIDKRLRMPGFRKKEGEQHIYFFYPLQNEEYNYGYVVFVDGTYIIQEDFRVYEYLEKMEQTLMQFRINLRLEMVNKELRYLYDKDPMTGLYNRFCFVSHAVPLIEESKAHKKNAMVMFADINDLKKINDRYGHAFGDRAIKSVAEAVKESISDDNAIGIRYGGDEFLVIAANATRKYAEEIRRKINSNIEKENSLGINPVKFSVSIGYVLTDPKSDKSVTDYVDEADKLMYEIKNAYHGKDDSTD